MRKREGRWRKEGGGRGPWKAERTTSSGLLAKNGAEARGRCRGVKGEWGRKEKR